MYCRMLQGEHSAILSTFNELPIVIKIFVLSIFEWPFHTGFTVPILEEIVLFFRALMDNLMHWVPPNFVSGPVLRMA